MFSFRKIISTLVLISYIKAIMVTSFAMEPTWPSPKHQLKLKIQQQIGADQTIERVTLSLIEKDLTTGNKKIKHRETIADPYQPLPLGVRSIIDQGDVTGFSWNLAELGLIRYDLSGAVSIDGMTYLNQDSLLKISGSNVIILRNCQLFNLQIKGISALLMGENHVTCLDSRTSKGISVFRQDDNEDAVDHLHHLRLRSGNFVSNGQYTVADVGIWNLNGGKYINGGTLISQGTHLVQNVSLFSNEGTLTGDHLDIDAQTYINARTGKINLNTHRVKVLTNFANDGQIHTRKQGCYLWGAVAANNGQITSDEAYSFASAYINTVSDLVNNGLMQARIGEFGAIKVVNKGEINHQEGLYCTTDIENRGTFRLGHMPHESASRLLKLRNHSDMGGSGFLRVMHGFNLGILDFSLVTLLLGEHSTFSNSKDIWLKGLSGQGIFFNGGVFHTPLDSACLMNVRQFQAISSKAAIQGGDLDIGETVEYFLTGKSHSINLKSLYIHESKLDSILNLNGAIKTEHFENMRRGTLIEGTVQTGSLILRNHWMVVSKSGNLAAIRSNFNHAGLKNLGVTDLGRLELYDSLFNNQNTLSAQVTLQVIYYITEQNLNTGTFTTRYVDETDPAHKHMHEFLKTQLDNQGKIIIEGDYTPLVDATTPTPTLQVVNPGTGTVEVLGTTYISEPRMSNAYWEFKDRFTLGQIQINGLGQDIFFHDGQNWGFAKKIYVHNGKTVFVLGDVKLNAPTLKSVNEFWVQKLLEICQGDLALEDSARLTIGLDNTRMGKIHVHNGTLSAHVKDRVDAKYGSIRARHKISLEADTGPIQIGDKIFLSPAQVAARIPHSSYSLLGGGHNYNTRAPGNHHIIGYYGFYLSNDSSIVSDEGQLAFKSSTGVNASFCTLQAPEGMSCAAPDMDFQNTNFLLQADSYFNGTKFRFHRTPNVLFTISNGYYGNYTAFRALTQTSYVPTMMLLGSLHLNCAVEFAGVDAFIADQIIYGDQVIREAAAGRTLLKLSAYQHYNCSWERKPGRDFITNRGTSGGTLSLGQDLSLNAAGKVQIDGGAVSAVNFTANISALELQALMRTRERHTRPIETLDEVADGLVQKNPLFTTDANGGVTLKHGATASSSNSDIPILDPVSRTFSFNIPMNVPFYSDPLTQQLAFIVQMEKSRGRIYGDEGESPQQLWHQSITRANEMAKVGIEITPETLGSINKLLIFFQMKERKGKKFIVAAAHIPQTQAEDKVSSSGGIRTNSTAIKTDTYVNTGARITVSGDDKDFTLQAKVATVKPAHFTEGISSYTARATHAAEGKNANIHVHLGKDSTLHGLDSRATGSNTLTSDAGVHMTDSAHHAGTKSHVHVADHLRADSSTLTGDDGCFLKATDLTGQTLVQTLYTSHGYQQHARHRTEFGSKYGVVVMQTTADMLAKGVNIYGAGIHAQAGGNRIFDGVPLHGYDHHRWKKHKITTQTCHHLRTQLNAHGQTRPADTTQPQASSSEPQIPTSTSTKRPEVTVEDVLEDDQYTSKVYNKDATWIGPKIEPDPSTTQSQALKSRNRAVLPGGVTIEDVVEDDADLRHSQAESQTDEPCSPQPQDTPTKPGRPQLSEDLEYSVAPGEILTKADKSSMDAGVLKRATSNVTNHSQDKSIETTLSDSITVTDVKKSYNWKARKVKRTATHAEVTPTVTETYSGGNVKSGGDTESTFQGSHIKAAGTITLGSKQGRVNLLTAQGYTYDTDKKSSTDGAWQTSSSTSAFHEQRRYCTFHSEQDSGVRIDAGDGVYVEIVVEQHSNITSRSCRKPKTSSSSNLKNTSNQPGLEWLQLLDERNDVIRIHVDERHDTTRISQQGLTAAAKIIATIILTAVTCGAGGVLATLGTTVATAVEAGVATTIVSSTVTAVASAVVNHFAIGMVDQRGRIDRVGKTFISKDSLKCLAVTALTSVFTAGMADKLGVKTTNLNGFDEQLKGNAVKATSSFVANTAVHGDIGRAAQCAGTCFVVDTAAGTAANQLGVNRDAELQSGDTTQAYILHKAFHGMLGAVKGAAASALNGDSGEEVTRATLGGAIGGVTAEIIAEGMRGDIQERSFIRAMNGGSSANLSEIQADELDRIRSLGQVASVALAKLFGADVEAACDAARNAVENNFVFAIPYVVAGGTAVWAACDLYDTYREHGAEAALQQAGVELATAYVGGAVLKRGYKIAGAVYPSAELAWTAYLSQSPKVAAVAEFCANKAGRIKDIIAETKVTQFLHKIDTAIETKLRRWFGMDAKIGIETGPDRFWTKSVQFKGNKVYQRDDLFDPSFVDRNGMSNLERMKVGKAPLSLDNKPINIHHMLQTQDGALAELAESFHKQYSSIIHINPNTIPSGINRPVFDIWRQKYWKNRANDFTSKN